MNDPLDDLQFSPFSPIYDQEQQVDEPYVWVKKSSGFKTFSRKALILKAIRPAQLQSGRTPHERAALARAATAP